MTRRDSCQGRLLRADLSHLSLEQCIVGAGSDPGTRTWMVSVPCQEAWTFPYRHSLGSPGKFETKKHRDQIHAQWGETAVPLGT